MIGPEGGTPTHVDFLFKVKNGNGSKRKDKYLNQDLVKHFLCYTSSIKPNLNPHRTILEYTVKVPELVRF